MVSLKPVKSEVRNPYQTIIEILTTLKNSNNFHQSSLKLITNSLFITDSATLSNTGLPPPTPLMTHPRLLAISDAISLEDLSHQQFITYACSWFSAPSSSSGGVSSRAAPLYCPLKSGVLSSVLAEVWSPAVTYLGVDSGVESFVNTAILLRCLRKSLFKELCWSMLWNVLLSHYGFFGVFFCWYCRKRVNLYNLYKRPWKLVLL